MFDLALTLVVVVILVLAGGASIYSLPWEEAELNAASRGVTGVLNLALIAFSAMLMLAMMLS